MTVAALPNYVTFQGNGTVGPFTFLMTFDTNSEIIVTIQAAGGQPYVLAQAAYTLLGAGLGTGGSVTLASILPIGSTITVTRILPLAQNTALVDGGPYFASNVMKMSDRIVKMIQQQIGQIPTPESYISEVSASTYGTDIATAIAVIGSGSATLVVDSPMTCNDNTTCPSNISLIVRVPGAVNIASGKVLTLVGSFSAPMSQVFTGSGSVIGIKEASLEWWGGYSDGTHATETTAALRSAINALRSEPTSILQEVGGATITAYSSGPVRFRKGVYLLTPDFQITQDLGVQFIGAGSRGTNNSIHGATTLLFTGIPTAYGFQFYGSGARSAKFIDMDIAYDSASFNGDIIDNYSSPGMKMIDCYVGTYGITSGTRHQTARSAVSTTYDEALIFDRVVFDGAQYGWYSNDTRGSLTFGGSGTTIKSCWFYDFAISPIYHAGNRTREGLSIESTFFNPISLSYVRAINITNVEGLSLYSCGFAGSTSYSASSEWVKISNTTGTIEGNVFDDNAPAGSLDGMLSIVGNRVYTTTGFTLTGGVISSRNNEMSKSTSGFIISPAYNLAIDLGPDLFKATVTNSYYIAADSSSLSGRIVYDALNDASTAKFTNASSRVMIDSLSSKVTDVSTTPYAIAITDTGETVVTTGSSSQVVNLPTPVAGTRLRIVKGSTSSLVVNCYSGTHFYTGATSTSTIATDSTAELGAILELQAYGTVGWFVVKTGTWVMSS